MSDTTTSGQAHQADTHGTAASSFQSAQSSIGPYSLLEKLGEGGMGAVYKAMHVNLKKVMAIKVLAPRRELRDGVVNRFYQEMEAIGRLDHPNLVRATDAGEDQGRHFLVMEYVDGEDVAKILRRRKTLTIAEACAIVRQTALGLQYLADQNLVHRDIKPSNLMMTASGQVKILDLGLALLQREAADEASELTNPGQVMGTWDYMAPEQTFDSHQVDIRADIYSLGCTFYKMLTGSAPFSSAVYATNRDKVLAHRAVEATPLSQLVPGAPPALEGVLQRMLAKAPADRFQSPAELLQALDTVAPEATPVASRESFANRSQSSATSKTDELPSDAGVVASLRRLSGKSWPVGVAAAGFMIVAIIIWPRGDPPPATGQWHSLMEAAPRRLHWSNNLPQPVWNDKRKEILAAPAGDLGILGLGRVPAKIKNYRFRVNMRQNPWSSNVGIVFGFREKVDNDERVIRYQSVGLVEQPDGSLLMERRRTVGTFPAEGPSRFQSAIIMSQFTARPPRDEEPLEIEVHGSHLLRVIWAGVELPDLCRPALNAQFTEEDYAGEVGVFCSNNMAIFRNGEMMLLEP